MSHTHKVELIAHVLQTMEDIHKMVAHACPLETYDITPLQLSALKYLYAVSYTHLMEYGIFIFR